MEERNRSWCDKMAQSLLEETYVPTSFEDYIERVSEEREGKFTLALWMSILSILGPILISMFLLQYLVFMEMNLWTGLSISFSLCVGMLYALHEWQRKETGYLQGKQILIITFRLRAGFSFQDYALIKNVKRLRLDDNVTARLKPLYPIEIEFEDFPYFDKLIVYSPCEWDGLLQFMPMLVLWKMFITTASAALISVVRLKEYSLGIDGIIPHVYPTDSDYEADKWLSIANTLKIGEADIEATQQNYEKIKYIEMERLYEGSQRELATERAANLSLDERAAAMAGRLVNKAIETGEVNKFNKRSLWAMIMKNKKYVVAGIVLVIIAFVLYGGALFK
jgi:hypothetical protein